ncbi:hypothetical protein [Actinomadura harenae]|uniref:hypothetical protein n=1 Tax=Actinomadura harenae TaxID=2483351 RepID=UPI001F2F3351|nr:hypothetical protein [Actinomadura harenae]
MKVAEWLAWWLENHPGAASTVAGYADHARRYLVPLLGELLLAEVSAGHVEQMLATIADEHAKSRRPQRVDARSPPGSRRRRGGDGGAVELFVRSSVSLAVKPTLTTLGIASLLST